MDNYINEATKIRRLSFGEELANSLIHGISALAVLVLTPIIIILLYRDYAIANINFRDLLGVTVFLICIFSMLLMSTLYHSTPLKAEKQKGVMRKLDHIFIFVAIAGSYTPIAISLLWSIPRYGKAFAISIISIQWLMVLIGILMKTLTKSTKIATTIPIYLIMGWTIAVIFPPFFKYANPIFFYLKLAGGLFYSGGVIFFAFWRTKYMHTIWHFFVTFGAVSHLIAIGFFLL